MWLWLGECRDAYVLRDKRLGIRPDVVWFKSGSDSRRDFWLAVSSTRSVSFFSQNRKLPSHLTRLDIPSRSFRFRSMRPVIEFNEVQNQQASPTRRWDVVVDKRKKPSAPGDQINDKRDRLGQRGWLHLIWGGSCTR